MRTKLFLAAGMLAAGVSANAQITKNRKYDWGWSYKLEMPETGLRCEFPARPVTTTLAYGYMAAAANNDELYLAVKMENPDPYDIQCRTEEFSAELEKVYGLPLGDLKWDAVQTENGNLTLSGNSTGGYADFHVDAIATEDVITIFLYSDHRELSVPGHFFASSYSVYDTKEGNLCYQADAAGTQPTATKTHTSIPGTSLITSWPGAPIVTTHRHETDYSLRSGETAYSEKVVKLESDVSYMQFITFVNREEAQRGTAYGTTITSDNTETIDANLDEPVLIRKLKSENPQTTFHRTYALVKGRIVIQEVASSGQLSNSDNRFLNSLDESIRNTYGPVFVSK
ncbi:MAG: hypothetical protein GC178_01175 [Flavobacteriales bacterium]|nr:hypothetical protein [Flavobacteriales bacterium]